MGAEQLGSWHSAEYAARWAGEDVVAGMLELPRRLSAAIVADAGVAVEHVIDLGSGPGAYLELFLGAHPGARGTWVDSSEAMVPLAREGPLAPFGDRVRFVLADVERLDEQELEPAQVVVSSRALHHSSAEALARIYRSAFDLVVPGGFVFNLDHVGAPGDWEERLRRLRGQFTGRRRSALRPHRHDYPLATVDEHLRLVAAAGFEAPDAPWRTLYTALIAARRPA